MKKIIVLILMSFSIFGLSGCANKVAEYAVSSTNIIILKGMSKNGKGISLGDFTDSNRKESMVMCGLTRPIGIANGETFISYIKKAFEKELLIGDMYDEKSNVKIGINLDDIYGSTILANAYWKFNVTVNSSNGKSFKVESKYDYESSYFSNSACSEMQRSFVPAVQKLLQDVIEDNEFKNLLN